MTRDTNISRRGVVKALGGAATLSVTGVTEAAAQSNETDETTPEPGPPGVVAQIGETLTLRSWEWESDRSRFALVMSSEIPSRIKITDTAAVMNAMTTGDGGGAFEIPTEGRTLQSGEQTVYFDGQTFNGVAAITVASTSGAVLVRTDSIQMGRPAVGYSTAGLLTAGAAVGSGWFSFRRARDKLQEEDEPEADRIA